MPTDAASARRAASRPGRRRHACESSIFSRLDARFDLTGARVLDLFAGSGSLGLEALFTRAAHVTFVDSSRGAAATIAKNLKVFGLTMRRGC